MSNSPVPEFKSEQYEFNQEQHRTIGELAASMDLVAMLMKILGLVFLIFFGLLLYQAIQATTGYAAVAGLGAATLLFLTFGFWTSGSAHSFRRIVESKNQDIWHLMNALNTLKSMYGLMRTIIIGSLVLAVVGVALYLFERTSNN